LFDVWNISFEGKSRAEMRLCKALKVLESAEKRRAKFSDCGKGTCLFKMQRATPECASSTAVEFLCLVRLRSAYSLFYPEILVRLRSVDLPFLAVVRDQSFF
jgi:hypothetical protein